VLCGIHRDFYSDQVIVDGPRLYLIDFDLYCLGDPALDIGNFLGHITEQSLRTLGDAGALAEVERALEERFIELSGEAVRPAVRGYAVLTLARHIYLSTRFPERRPWTERLLELCEERLGVAARPCA
jgi:aminoglycoside phosphotransferase (APT) family kinase protein